MSIFEKQLLLSGEQGKNINPFFVLGIQKDFARQHEPVLRDVMKKMLKSLMSHYHPDKQQHKNVSNEQEKLTRDLSQALEMLNDNDAYKMAREYFFAQSQEDLLKQEKDKFEKQLNRFEKSERELKNKCHTLQTEHAKLQQKSKNQQHYFETLMSGAPVETKQFFYDLETIEAFQISFTISENEGVSLAQIQAAIKALPEFEQWDFFREQRIGKPYQKYQFGELSSRLKSGHLPHHQAALRTLSAFFETLANKQVKYLSAFAVKIVNYEVHPFKALKRIPHKGKKEQQLRLLGAMPLSEGLGLINKNWVDAEILPKLISSSQFDPLLLGLSHWLVYDHPKKNDQPQFYNQIQICDLVYHLSSKVNTNKK